VEASAVVGEIQCSESLVEHGTSGEMRAIDEPSSVCNCVTELAVKRLFSCGDAVHCVDSVRLGNVELVHAADFDGGRGLILLRVVGRGGRRKRAVLGLGCHAVWRLGRPR
jgi:hypothetical protein